MMIKKSCTIKYLGILFFVVFLLLGCSSGSGDSSDTSSNDDSNDSGSTSDTTTNVEEPGALGSLTDIGDLVSAGDNWYETRIMALGDDGSVVGQTTRSGGPVKAAFLWDASTQAMTYLGIHGEGDLSAYPIYDDTDSDPHAFIYSEAVDIGPTGDIICNSTTGYDWPDETEKRGFYYSGGTLTDLPPLDGTDPADDSDDGHFSEAFFISQDYVLYNAEIEKDDNKIGFYWDKSGSPYTGVLGQIVGAALVEPVGINNYNQAAVNSDSTSTVFHDLDVDAVQTLNNLPGATETIASAINDSQPTGHIVGTSDDIAFFWDGGSMYPCGDLGGGTSEATDLNDSDQVVGSSTTSNGSTHAFLWELNASGQGEMVDLGTLGGSNSYAVAINNNGLIVGYSETGETYDQGGVTASIVHACAWYGNTIYDLGVHNDFYAYPFVESYPFSEAIDVNDDNRIAGNSYTINSHYRGFIIDAVLP